MYYEFVSSSCYFKLEIFLEEDIFRPMTLISTEKTTTPTLTLIR